MPTPDELDKLAAAGNGLRPDWPTDQLRSHLAANYGRKGYQELATALAWVATIPGADPTWLANDGPWWHATDQPTTVTTKSGQRQKCPEHHIPLTAGSCERCTDRTADYQPGRAAELWRQIKNQEDQP